MLPQNRKLKGGGNTGAHDNAFLNYQEVESRMWLKQVRQNAML